MMPILVLDIHLEHFYNFYFYISRQQPFVFLSKLLSPVLVKIVQLFFRIAHFISIFCVILYVDVVHVVPPPIYLFT